MDTLYTPHEHKFARIMINRIFYLYILFPKTIDAGNKFSIPHVFKAQGVFENFAFWDTVCISVKLYHIKKVTNKSNVLFHVEISGVIRFFLGLAGFEK